MKKIKYILVALVFITITANAQVRKDLITDFTPAQRTTLANLMMDYITPQIVQYHCDYINQSGGEATDIHSDFDFLPFHRVYIEGMEDYFISKGFPEFVPLPAWNPADCTPIELQVIDPECGTFFCQFGSAVTCGSVNNWCPNNPIPPYLQDLCQYPFSPTVPGNSDSNGLSNKLEAPWHNSVHSGANGMNGLMGNFRSPAAPIFWLWHAFLDDMWKDWEENCSQSTALPVDLYMKDNSFVMQSYRDRGQEPNLDDGPMWTSTDIWVRNQADGVAIQIHENPVYGQTNYVYVRVRNRGYQTSLGTEQLKLYWAKANTALDWPNHWDGSMTNGGGFLLGDILDTKTIPQTDGQDQTILEFAWNNVPNPDDYTSGQGSVNPHHFCLLTRVEATNDPMFDEINGSVYHNAQYNNNIAWKNLSVIDLTPNATDPNPCASVFVGNYNGTAGNFDLEFVLPRNYKGNPVLAEAEVLVTLDETLWGKWDTNGRQEQNLSLRSEGNKEVIIDENNASLKNLNFQANEYALLNVCFRFVAKEMTGQKDFDFHVVQRDSNTGEIIGGETFHIEVEGKDGFYADAGSDQEISQGETADISAYEINEDVVYNWYDQDGNLISTGIDVSVSPEITKKYKLEVISDNGGIIDYDDIEIKVKEYEILSMSPNPASNQVNINYNATNASSAYIMVTQPYGNTSNYILDVNQSTININLTGYTTGLYYAVMVCNGEVYDSKTLIVE